MPAYALRVRDYQTTRQGVWEEETIIRKAGEYFVFRRHATRDAFLALSNKHHPDCYAAASALPEGAFVNRLYENDPPDKFIDDGEGR